MIEVVSREIVDLFIDPNQLSFVTVNLNVQNKEKLSDLSAQKDEEMINDLSKQIIKLGGKPNIENEENKTLIKELSKQLEQLKFSSILENNSKNYS